MQVHRGLLQRPCPAGMLLRAERRREPPQLGPGGVHVPRVHDAGEPVHPRHGRVQLVPHGHQPSARTQHPRRLGAARRRLHPVPGLGRHHDVGARLRQPRRLGGARHRAHTPVRRCGDLAFEDLPHGRGRLHGGHGPHPLDRQGGEGPSEQARARADLHHVKSKIEPLAEALQDPRHGLGRIGRADGVVVLPAGVGEGVACLPAGAGRPARQSGDARARPGHRSEGVAARMARACSTSCVIWATSFSTPSYATMPRRRCTNSTSMCWP